MTQLRWVRGLLCGVVLAAANAAQAQYGGGGGMGGGMGGGYGGHGGHGGRGGYGGGGDNGGDKQLSAYRHAFDPDNPISLIMAAKKDLKLSDSQVVALHGLGDSLRAKDAPLRLRIDSVRMAGGGDTTTLNLAALTPSERDSVMAVRQAMATWRGQIHDNASATRTAALALMTEKQQAKYAELEERVLDSHPTDTLGGPAHNGRGGYGGSGGGDASGTAPPQ